MKKLVCLFVNFALSLFFTSIAFAGEAVYQTYVREINGGCSGEHTLVRAFGYTEFWDGHWGYVNACGNIIVDYDYANASEFSDGFGILYGQYELFAGQQGHAFDKNGNKVFENDSWSIIGPFSEGLAPIKDGLYEGYINQNGEIVVEPILYSVRKGFSEGIAVVDKYENDLWTHHLTAIDHNGNDLFLFPDNIETESKFHEGRIPVFDKSSRYDHKQLGYMDNAGNLVIPMVYEDARDFSEGLAAVQKHGWWGFIDLDGKQVIDFDYDLVGDFHEGYARVLKDGYWGLIDHDGNEIVETKRTLVSDVSEGIIRIGSQYASHDDNEWDFSYYDLTDGHLIRKFSNIRYGGDFHEGLAVIVVNSEERHVINKEGEIVFDFPKGFRLNHLKESPYPVRVMRNWDVCDFFRNGMVMVVNDQTSEYGFINAAGEYHRLFRLN